MMKKQILLIRLLFIDKRKGQIDEVCPFGIFLLN
ncbi:hypothetical protein JOC95_000668 [Bacillus tianshenii]|uniref:Uncharacterized protein n=1 Tax=Sutcliffiella tianshenii TaxID=1463404 RepID=A0ABS2NVY1_9BACI|nr:hypothetical protein [Bacillus tianshenii]